MTDRTRIKKRSVTHLFCAIAALGSTHAAFAANKAQVELLPAVTAIAPGEPFDIALQFSMVKEWHIYWKNPITGVPPKVSWTLPDGFQAGPLQFPLPTRKTKSGVVTNLLAENPLLLVTITPPRTLSASKPIKIKGDFSWLVCKEQCLMEKQAASISIPVVQSAAESKPANERVIKRARRALPVPAAKAKYLKLKASMGSGTLSPESTFEIVLDVSINRGFHIQSNKPLMKGLVPTDVFLNPNEPLFFDPAIFPEPVIKNVPSVGKLSEFGGKIKIRIPVEADTELPGDSLTIGGVLVYQTCNERGTCFPKAGAEWSLDVPITLAAAPATGQKHAAAETIEPSPPATTLEVPEDDTTPAGATSDAGIATGEVSANAPWWKRFMDRWGLWAVGLLSFGYGLVLNATPCVLPLLSIKVMGFVQQAHESRRRTTMLGLSFGVGVILFFVVLGLLASRGNNILQYPSAVIALGAIVMALSLSMLGVYTLQAPAAASKLDSQIKKEGLVASFGKGLLAPVLGFACTGPLLAGVFSWATQQEPKVAILSFAASGLGMASPYMLLGANPKLLSFVPKPGNWMITFERIMGFLLLAMVISLIHPLVTHIGAEGLEWTLAFFVAVAMACWVLGKVNLMMEKGVQWRYRGTSAAIVLVAGFGIYGWAYPIGEAVAHQKALRAQVVGGNDWSHSVPWRHWSEEAVKESVESGKVVFVDFTSAYCTNCKINKKTVIYTDAVMRKLQELDVIPFQADFTDGDPAVFAAMQSHGRAGPPLNLVYTPGAPKPAILRPLLGTPSYLIEKLEAAANKNRLASAPAS